MNSQQQVISQITSLVREPGYIYALCMILFEDFHIDIEKSHEVNYRDRLSNKEAGFILGLLIQNEIDYSHPAQPEELMTMKVRTYELMQQLHGTFNEVFIDKFRATFEARKKDPNHTLDEKSFFGTADMLAEPIFYSGTGVYDVQYLEFLEAKYARDRDWLAKNKRFDTTQAKAITLYIKETLQTKSEKVNLVRPKDKLPELREKMKGDASDEEWDENVKKLLPMLEVYQYVNLFFDYSEADEITSLADIREDGWKSFYRGLIDLFVVSRTELEELPGGSDFLTNFSIEPGHGVNPRLQVVGDYNEIHSHPLIRLDEERYFVPVSFMVFEAVYESPFYWMIDDVSYRDQAGKNRGEVGEQLTYDFLVKVFGENRTFKSVKVKSLKTKDSTKRREDKTDIDVLCVLGSKALCVQVKSKKLTELAKKGNDIALGKDFKAAVQDAYDQGRTSRLAILSKEATFLDEDGNEIALSEAIDEVYIMGITTENYPSLTHHTSALLIKEEVDPYPLVLTIFDLDLLTYYLRDPYDFLYYIRQRIKLMDFFRADEELVFLGFHLTHKLWKVPKMDLHALDNQYGLLIDRNYYPKKLGLELPNDSDRIANRWRNENFDKLCSQIKSLKEPKTTDIIFHLYDWSSDAIDALQKYINKAKRQVLSDGKRHNFSIPPDGKSSPRVGVTYFVTESNSSTELSNRLVSLAHLRKYKSRGDVWIGLGSMKDSSEIIDAVFYEEGSWEYDEELERLSNEFLEGSGHGRLIRLGEKIGRNEKCPCGSMQKFKRCCGE